MRIAILIFDKLTALDAIGPYEVLSRIPGAELTFVAQEAGPKRTDTGRLAITADAGLDELTDPDITGENSFGATNFYALTDAQEQLLRDAFALWSAVSRITFVEVDDALAANLAIGSNDIPGVTNGYAQYPEGGEIWIDHADPTDVDPEIGRAHV